MWSSALKVIAENPIIGVGGTAKMESAGAQAGGNAWLVEAYQHLHNLFLDEAVTSGLVGMALMTSVFISFMVHVRLGSASRDLTSTASLLLAFVVTFGSFHGILLNEWTLIVLFGMIGTMLAELTRTRPPRPSIEQGKTDGG